MSAMTGALIPAQPTGKDFLKSSNVLAVRDSDGITPDQIYLSTCQRDFRTASHFAKCATLSQPTPAQIEHMDHRILERCTEALRSFKCPLPQSIHRMPAWAKLGTNLKMHADHRQATFITTKAEGFRPPPASSASRLTRPKVAPLRSSGDERLPQTTHRETFPAYTVLPVVKAPARHLGGESTIRGDNGRVCFSTHHKEAFQGTWCPPPALVEKQFRSSLPMGDPEKLVERETTQAASFTPPRAPRPAGVMERLKVNLGDTDNKWVSTTADAYRRVKAERVLQRHRTTRCSMPMGDVDPEQNRARMTTTNKVFFSEENHRELPARVDGSKLRTRSNVQFGRPSLGKMFYKTSSGLDYPRKEGLRAQPHTHPSGHVLSALEPEPAITTVQRDYRASNGRRQELPPTQLKRVKESHISPPCKEHHFSTTHNEAFIPLPLCKQLPIDTYSQLYSHNFLRFEREDLKFHVLYHLKMLFKSIKSFQLELDGPDDAVYTSGEMVTGQVVLELNRDIKVRSMRVLGRGVAMAHWLENRSVGMNTVYSDYTSKITYFRKRQHLIRGN
ncbi:hypothetical protein ACEWY4_014825 [Coilia grayii]|uniref:Arrestin-like N-terminal domain-containing protein n=1 Tax=Coilia grayii TaxID=363190 RepID=A0ABD1JTG0_9TELE